MDACARQSGPSRTAAGLELCRAGADGRSGPRVHVPSHLRGPEWGSFGRRRGGRGSAVQGLLPRETLFLSPPRLPLMPRAYFLSRFTSTRRALRDLKRMADAEERIAAALEKIANRYDPPPLAVTERDLRDTGPTYSRDEEQFQIQEFENRVYRDTGRWPTEDEVAAMLRGEPT